MEKCVTHILNSLKSLFSIDFHCLTLSQFRNWPLVHTNNVGVGVICSIIQYVRRNAFSWNFSACPPSCYCTVEGSGSTDDGGGSQRVLIVTGTILLYSTVLYCRLDTGLGAVRCLAKGASTSSTFPTLHQSLHPHYVCSHPVLIRPLHKYIMSILAPYCILYPPPPHPHAHARAWSCTHSVQDPSCKLDLVE